MMSKNRKQYQTDFKYVTILILLLSYTLVYYSFLAGLSHFRRRNSTKKELKGKGCGKKLIAKQVFPCYLIPMSSSQ
jgi:hypothetical protein